MNSLCPKCNNSVPNDAKFCPNCSAPLTSGSSDAAWIASMQEKIKENKHNRTMMFVLGIVAIILGLAAYTMMRFTDVVNTINGTHTSTSSMIIAVILASLFMIATFIIAIIYDAKVKSLIDQLARGQVKQQ